MYEKIFFYLFAGLGLFAASGVILSRHLVHRVLFLILAFVATAAIWLLLRAEFLALLLALVYIGAVLVLFLFIIMIFDLKPDGKEKLSWFKVIGISMAGLLLGILVYVIAIHGLGIDNSVVFAKQIAGQGELVQMGTLLFTTYLVPLEMAGVLLLATIVAAIGLLKESK